MEQTRIRRPGGMAALQRAPLHEARAAAQDFAGRFAASPAMAAQRLRVAQLFGDPVVQRFADYYAWGAANVTPHVHVYNSGMHLKAAGGHRYNVVQNGNKAAAADQALAQVQGKGNKKLRQTIKHTAHDVFGVDL